MADPAEVGRSGGAHRRPQGGAVAPHRRPPRGLRWAATEGANAPWGCPGSPWWAAVERSGRCHCVPVWSALSSLAMALCFIYLVAISLSFSFTPAFRDSPLGHMLHASLSFSCAHPTCSLFKFSLSVHFSFLSAASILSEFLFTFLPCLSWATFSVFFCICVSLLLVDFLSQHHSVALCLLVFLSSTFLLSVHFEHFISLQVCVSLVF